MKTNTNISLTGQRILSIFLLLIEQSASKSEINNHLIKNKFASKELSSDTITLYINVLRKSGLLINRPHQSNDYKYGIKNSAACLFFGTEEINYLQNLKLYYCENGDWQKILYLNKTMNKLKFFIVPEMQKKFEEMVLNSIPFGIKDNHKIEQLDAYSKHKTVLKIIYHSPNSGEHIYKIVPNDICIENQKLYLWCTNIETAQTHYLRIDRMKLFERLNVDLPPIKEQKQSVKYLLTGQEGLLFEQNPKYDKILLQNDNEILVESIVINEFWFIQKILSYGKDCLIIEPEEYRIKLKNKLKETILQYV